MKTFSKSFGTFWTGQTGKQLAGMGPWPRLLAKYLTDSPAALAGDNYGIYHVERDTILRHLDLPPPEFQAAVLTLARAQFAFWDAVTEWVFLPEAARFQYDTPLLPKDFNCRNARRFYRRLPKNPWLAPWFDRYVEDLCLDRDPDPVNRREWRGLDPMPQFAGAELPIVTRASGRGIARVTTDPIDDGFQRFWSTYPKPSGYAQALEAWLEVNPRGELTAEILAGVEVQAPGVDFKENGRFIPMPAKYLREGRWRDRPVRKPQGAESVGRMKPTREEHIGRMVRRLEQLPTSDAIAAALDALRLPEADLESIDRALVEAAIAAMDPMELRDAAMARVAAFRGRVAGTVFDGMVTATMQAIARERANLPEIAEL